MIDQDRIVAGGIERSPRLVRNRGVQKLFTGFQLEITDFKEAPLTGVMALQPSPSDQVLTSTLHEGKCIESVERLERRSKSDCDVGLDILNVLQANRKPNQAGGNASG